MSSFTEKYNTNNSTLIAVISCYAYRDAWRPFIDLLRRFWPDCPYQVVLVTDQAGSALYDVYGWDYIHQCGSDLGWAKNLLHFFSTLDERTQNILLMQEDFFITELVDTTKIKLADDAAKLAHCVRIYPCPGPDTKLTDDFGLIAEDAPYRVSCQAAVWNREHLTSILDKVNTPFEFEIEGTKLKLKGTYLSVYREKKYPLSYICSAISRGKWNPDAIKLCQTLGIDIDTTMRPIEGASKQ